MLRTTATVGLLFALMACSSSSGDSGGGCPAGDTCTPNGGAAGAVGAGAGGTTSHAGNAGAGGGASGQGGSPGCGLSYKAATCDTCMTNSCCAAESACASNADCGALITCGSGCTTTTCLDACISAHPAGTTLLNAVVSCQNLHCDAPCSSVPDGLPLECDSCVRSSCQKEVSACDAKAACSGLGACLAAGPSVDCAAESCVGTDPSANDLLVCMSMNCSTACHADPGFPCGN